MPLLKPAMDYAHTPTGLTWLDTNGLARLDRFASQFPQAEVETELTFADEKEADAYREVIVPIHRDWRAALRLDGGARVLVFGNLLSAEECEAIIELARPRMARSETVAEDKEGSEVNMARTSRGMFFERGEAEVVARVEARIARLLNWPLENGEGMQVLHYQPGAEYQPHYDYFDARHASTPSILKRGGQRVGTLVMYLNTPKRGGATTFPDVKMAVQPIRGNAVFFSYPKPEPATLTLHGGAPVLEGEKWVATKWMRQGRFE